MAKYTRKPKKLDAAAEARLEPLVRRADEDARHYISALARIALVGVGDTGGKRAKEAEDPMKILGAAKVWYNPRNGHIGGGSPSC